MTFTQSADFSEATFTQSADFSRTTFTGTTSFLGVAFTQSADFSGATFTQSADFSGATFEGEPIFEYVLNNKIYKARFSSKANPEDYNFKVSHDSPYKIDTEEQKFNGRKFTIPKGAELFDPDDPSEREENGES